MGGALDLEEHADLEAGIFAAHLRDAQRAVGADMLELHRLLEAIARHIGLHLGHHLLDAAADRVLVGLVAQAIDGVAHDQRRLRRVEDDDRLAARRAADVDDRLARRLGELVDIGPRPRPRALRADRGDDLAVMHLGDPVDRRDDRDRRLPAARHHVDVGRIEVGAAVDRRDRIGPDRRRRQVDHPLAGGEHQLAVALVRARRRRVEDDLDLGELRHLQQPVDALRGDRHPEPLGPLQSVRLRVDPDKRPHLQNIRQPHDLDHQIGPDVPRTDNRYLRLRHHITTFHR